MKTKQEIQQEIDSREQLGAKDGVDRESKEYKKSQREIIFYRDCLRYLESEPTQDFLSKEKVRLEKKLSLIKSGYPNWLHITLKTVYGDTAPETYYNRIMEVSKLKGQLDIINFLLQ